MAAITLEELLGEVGVHPEKLNECISDDHLLAIAFFLSSWRTVAPYLGLSENDLDAIEHEGRNEQVMKLKSLQKWKSEFSFKATYRKLVEVLLSLAMADNAEQVCRLLKGNVCALWCAYTACKGDSSASCQKDCKRLHVLIAVALHKDIVMERKQGNAVVWQISRLTND